MFCVCISIDEGCMTVIPKTLPFAAGLCCSKKFYLDGKLRCDVILCQYLFCTAFLENLLLPALASVCCWCCLLVLLVAGFCWVLHLIRILALYIAYIAMHIMCYDYTQWERAVWLRIHISRVCNFHINRASERQSNENHYALDGKTVDNSSQSMAVRPSIKTFTLCVFQIEQITIFFTIIKSDKIPNEIERERQKDTGVDTEY